MQSDLNRRTFLRRTAALAAGLGLAPLACRPTDKDAAESTPDAAPMTLSEPLFKISLAQWSLHRSLFSVNPAEMGWDVFGQTLHSDNYRTLLGGKIDPLDFARIARREFDIDGIEYVNTFYFDRARDMAYLREMKNVAEGEGVRSLLIMCDAEGNLGDPHADRRTAAVENHYKWIEAAAFLGCHSIRVNARSDAALSPEEQQRLAADGLRRLAEYGDGHGINVLVENHGGISSNGQWLAGVMQRVDHPRIGTLPDFGNFFLTEGPLDPAEHPEAWYDRYQGVTELMPYAKAVSAKTHRFDADGNEVETDFLRMMQIVLDAGYHGYVGIEYEGPDLDEMDGIRATKALLERVRQALEPRYA